MTEYGKELDTLLSDNAAHPLPSPPPYAQVVRERKKWRERAKAAEGEVSLLRKSLDEVARERDEAVEEIERLTQQPSDFRLLIEALWDAAYQQGIERRKVDDEHRTAQKAEDALTAYINSLQG